MIGTYIGVEPDNVGLLKAGSDPRLQVSDDFQLLAETGVVPTMSVLVDLNKYYSVLAIDHHIRSALVVACRKTCLNSALPYLSIAILTFKILCQVAHCLYLGAIVIKHMSDTSTEMTNYFDIGAILLQLFVGGGIWGFRGTKTFPVRILVANLVQSTSFEGSSVLGIIVLHIRRDTLGIRSIVYSMIIPTLLISQSFPSLLRLCLCTFLVGFLSDFLETKIFCLNFSTLLCLLLRLGASFSGFFLRLGRFLLRLLFQKDSALKLLLGILWLDALGN